MARFVVCSSVGAIGKPDGTHGDPNHKRGLSSDRAPWVHPTIADGTSMLDVVKTFKPTCLLGPPPSRRPLLEELVRAMSHTHAHRDADVEPDGEGQCTPQQAYEWTDGRAIIATGSRSIRSRSLPHSSRRGATTCTCSRASASPRPSPVRLTPPRASAPPPPPPRSPPPPPPPPPGVADHRPDVVPGGGGVHRRDDRGRDRQRPHLPRDLADTRITRRSRATSSRSRWTRTCAQSSAEKTSPRATR